MEKVVWMACCALLLSGCARQTVFVHEGNPGQPTREVRHDFVVAGIGQSEVVDASLACHGDPKKVVDEKNYRYDDSDKEMRRQKEEE